MKSPAFQFYPDDFVGSGTVALLRDYEIGIYLMLLCLDWSDDGFLFPDPGDTDELDRLAAWCKTDRKRLAAAWKRLAQVFPASEDSRRRNPRLQRERSKQAEWRAKSVNGGKASAAKRGTNTQPPVNHPSTTLAPVVEPNGQPKGNTPSPSPTPVTTTAPTPDAPVGDPRPAVSSTWPAQVARRWTAQVGGITEGRVGRDLLGPYRQFGLPVLLDAVDSFAKHRRLAVQRGAERPDNWPQFVRDLTDYIPKTVLAAVRARPDAAA